MKKGFSLIELSVVLVIIALLIGGILVGKTLVQSSRLQSVISDWQKYSTAANSYFTKYNYWPGDDADAQTKWAAALGPGNGDGALGTQTSQEYMYFWQDLSLAGFIAGSYPGTWGSASVVAVPTPQIPRSFMTHYYDSVNPTNQAFYMTGLNPTAKVGYSGETPTYILSAGDASSIDTKIDDGLPNQQTNNTGSVVAVGLSNNGADATKCINGTGIGTDTYQNSTSAVCNLYYIYKK